ncbi:putative phage integrase [Mycobacterium haemophilum DSM 44634]
MLPRFGVESPTGLVSKSGMDGPVYANRDGGWTSLNNMRRALRAALPADPSWVTTHSFLRTVATVVRDALGAGAGSAAALPREAGDHRGTLPSTADPRPRGTGRAG